MNCDTKLKRCVFSETPGSCRSEGSQTLTSGTVPSERLLFLKNHPVQEFLSSNLYDNSRPPEA